MDIELKEKIENLIMEIYVERAHEIMKQKVKNVEEMRSFVQNSLLVDNLHELQLYLHELVESKKIFTGGDHVYLDVLYHDLKFLNAMLYNFLEYLEEHDYYQNEVNFSNVKIFFKLFSLGIANEIIDNNVKSIIPYVHKNIARKNIIKVNNFSERAYFSKNLEDKIKYMLKTSEVQMNTFSKIDSHLEKLIEKQDLKINDIYEKNWNEYEYKDFYLKTVSFKEKVSILIGILNRIHYIN